MPVTITDTGHAASSRSPESSAASAAWYNTAGSRRTTAERRWRRCWPPRARCGCATKSPRGGAELHRAAAAPPVRAFRASCRAAGARFRLRLRRARPCAWRGSAPPAVIGVEPNADFADAARLRVRIAGLPTGWASGMSPNTRTLPFADGSFDAVVMNAVLEHIPPAARRRASARDLAGYRAEADICSSARRPTGSGRRTSTRRGCGSCPTCRSGWRDATRSVRKRVPADATLAWLLAEGIRGGSYWEVMAALRPAVRCLNLVQCDDVDWFWARSLAPIRAARQAG